MTNPKKKRVPGQAKVVYEPLVSDQYPELNAALYASNPSDYLRARLQGILQLMQGAPDQDYSMSEVRIGMLEGGPMPYLSKDVRLRYAAMDTSVLVHHAAETLVRLWLAHKDRPPCPWIAVSDLRVPSLFKDDANKLAEQRPDDFSRSSIASVFLGGETQIEADTDYDENLREDAISGFIALIQLAARKITADSDLYNAAKHGLVGVPALHGTHNINGFDVARGLGVTYLETVTFDFPAEGTPKKQRWATTNFIGLDSEIMSIELIIRGIHSIWATAKRNYVGHSGEIILVAHDAVLAAKAISVISDMRHVDAVSQKLPTYHSTSEGAPVIHKVEMRLRPTGVEEAEVAAMERYSNDRPPVTVVTLPRRPSDPDPTRQKSPTFFHFTGTR